MEYKYLFLGGAIILIVVGVFVFLYDPSIFYSGKESPSCEKIFYSGNSDEKVDVVFFTRGVGKNKIQKYIDSLLGFEPFDKQKDNFNFFYLDEKIDCNIKYSALFCYSLDLIQKSSGCPNDFIVVVSDESDGIRSSAYMNVISINDKLPISVFPHEFGHIFANLADEYIPAKIPFGSKNCAKNCKEFGKIVGCFQECSESDFFRSSENSIMRTLNSQSYFEFNQKIISEELEKW